MHLRITEANWRPTNPWEMGGGHSISSSLGQTRASLLRRGGGFGGTTGFLSKSCAGILEYLFRAACIHVIAIQRVQSYWHHDVPRQAIGKVAIKDSTTTSTRAATTHRHARLAEDMRFTGPSGFEVIFRYKKLFSLEAVYTVLGPLPLARYPQNVGCAAA